MGEHSVQFYHDETYLVEEIWGFIGPSLRSGESAVVIATRDRLDTIERKYSPSRLARIAGAGATSAYIALDAESTLAAILKDGKPNASRFETVIGDVLRRASRNGQQHVRAYGEMVALLCANGKADAAIELEEMWNKISGKYPFSLLCGYPMHAFADNAHCESFQHICHAHTNVRPTERYIEHSDREEMNRRIAALEQKANALESEVARRKKIEHVLQQRESELSDFLENAVEGMHRVGPDGTILWANNAELDLLGYTHDEYIGRHIADFHVDRHVIDDILGKLLAGETLYDHPARLRCKDGSIRHVLIHSNARVADGEFISTRCLTRDVTDRMQLEQELHKRLEQLAEVDRRKDEFLAMLGHELRNPLAPIMNSLELMRALGGDSPRQMVQSRETIARQVAHMTRLVDDLLDVSRITRGKIELRKEATTPVHVIERAVEIVRPLLDERRHALSIDLPAETVTMHGDPARLAQVVANLLHNAAKYTDCGGRIALSARRTGHKLEIVVSDNGIGLDNAAQEKIFDLFVQEAHSLANARGGLGLGLTLVRSLVRLHGGSVRAHSEGVGRGSTFTVTLPLHELQNERRAAPEVTEAGATASPRHRKILIVDDNVDAAESLGEFLKISGHAIHLAHDGASAIRTAAQLQPDVVILDIGMPALNGYQVAQRLRADVGLNSSLLLAVTGYAQERDRVAARAAGFDHHFAKPLDIRRLQAILNAAP
jgi:PAS domain S-box-containing protein